MAILTINMKATHKTVTCPHCHYAQLLVAKDVAEKLEAGDPDMLAKLHCGGPTSAHQLHHETYQFWGTFPPLHSEN